LFPAPGGGAVDPFSGGGLGLDFGVDPLADSTNETFDAILDFSSSVDESSSADMSDPFAGTGDDTADGPTTPLSVPEPSSIALTCVAAGLVLAVASRRRSQNQS
jgi:hypothetical protein